VPWFCWFNTTRMHINTHLKPESKGKTGLGVYPDGMVETDGHIGQLLAKLDELGLADNTIVVYTTDNGAEFFSWPDGGSTPFRSEKNTTWEGGFRIPLLIRWPGVIKPGTELNEIISLEDLLPTLLAAAGEGDVKEKLKAGHRAGDKTYKVHLDGFDLMPYFQGKTDEWPRPWFVYWTDDADFAGFRYKQYKFLYMTQEASGIEVWRRPFVKHRTPVLTTLRADPFERAMEESGNFEHWSMAHMFLMLPAIAGVSKFLQTFREFPPRQEPGSFNIDEIMDSLVASQSKLTV